MSIERINPPELYDSLAFGFSHATLRRGVATLHLAGQVAWDRDTRVVGGGDLRAQTAQCLRNLKGVLASIGCSPADIVRLRTYVVNHSPEKLEPVLGAISERNS